MNRGYVFDLLKLENGCVITLFSFFTIGLLKGNEGFGSFRCLQLGIGKLELTISLAWKNSSELSVDKTRGFS